MTELPVKRRITKHRAVCVSPEAVARWREVGPDAIPGWRYIADGVLADLLGLSPLLALSPTEQAALRAGLEGDHAD
jgi:hypothetical protein